MASATATASHSAGELGAAPVTSAVRPVSQSRWPSILSLEDLSQAGRRHLPAMLYGFVAGGAETEASLQANRAAYAGWCLLPRMLVDTSSRSQTTELFGRHYAAPFGIAPMGSSALMAYRGDIVLAQAARAANIPMILSASSLIRLEEVREAGSTWFQAYLPGDPARIEPLVDRVKAAGFDTFVLTVDIPVPANRENNTRNGFTIPVQPSLRLLWAGATHPAWLMGTAMRTLRRHGMPHFENMDAGRGPPILSKDVVRAVGPRDRLTWEHVALIRRRWPGRLVIKGLLAPADAALARDAGVDGVIVSNHGGRQLDGAVAPLQMLAEMKDQARDMVVMVDGGIRRGTDVLKARALGADFVFVGRPFLFAAAVGGEALVRHAASLLSQEVDRDMALMGVTSLDVLSPTSLRAAAN